MAANEQFTTEALDAGWISMKVSKSNHFGEGVASDEVLFEVQPPLSAAQRRQLEQMRAEQVAKEQKEKRIRVQARAEAKAAWLEQKQLLSLGRQLHTLVAVAVSAGQDCEWQIDEEEDVDFAAFAMGLSQLLASLDVELEDKEASEELEQDLGGARWFVENFGGMIDNWPQKALRQALRQAKALHKRKIDPASDESDPDESSVHAELLDEDDPSDSSDDPRGYWSSTLQQWMAESEPEHGSDDWLRWMDENDPWTDNVPWHYSLGDRG